MLGQGVGAGGQQDADQPRQVGRAHLPGHVVRSHHITLCPGHLDCGVAEADGEAVVRAGPRGRGRGADVRRAREGGDRDGVAVQHRQVVTVPAVWSH